MFQKSKIRNFKKIARHYRKGLKNKLIIPEEPSIDKPAFDRFYQLLKRANIFNEWGGGGSTRTALKLNASGVTVENDPFYAKELQKLYQQERVSHTSAQRTISYVNTGLTGTYGNPLLRMATPGRLKKWYNYVDVPHQSECFRFADLYLIDGRFRRACFLNLVRHLTAHDKTAIVLFDDYYKRSHYHMVESYIEATHRWGSMAEFQICRSALKATPHHDAITEASKDFR